ncbi:MAG: V-type ATP synthase subunit F [Clostridiales bacterium]|nr:V-type ATP synthase subunit F [Clostridiales bacterium]
MASKLFQMGVVGEEDAILAFKAIGAIAIPATTAEEISTAIHRLSRSGVPVIFITETAAALVPEALSRYEQIMETAIIPIPGIKGSNGFGAEQLRQSVIKAIGADILSQQQH